MESKRPNYNQIFIDAFSLFVFLLMWASQTTSKVSLVSLLRLHKFEEIQSATWYLSVCIILQAPNVFTIAYIIWKTPFISLAKWTKWPSMIKLFLGFLVSILEVVCLCVFLTELAPILPDHILVLLPGAVYIVPIILENFLAKRSQNVDAASPLSHSKTGKSCEFSPSIKYTIMCIGFASPAAVSAILFTWSPYNFQLLHVLLLPTVLLFLSILWIPRIQTDIVSSDGQLQGRWKTSLLYAITKIVAIPLCLCVILTTHFQDLRSAYFLDFLKDGCQELFRFEVYFPIILMTTSGFMVTFMGLIAVKIGLTTSVLFLTSILSTPTAITISMIECTSAPGPQGDLCKSHDLWLLISTFLSLLAWFCPLLVYGRLFARPTGTLLRPFDQCFLHFSWTTAFLEQKIILDYHPNGIGATPAETPPGLDRCVRSGSKVFICTTMYNEVDHEMKRLVESLFKVARSKKLGGVYLEIHIFLDNGSKDGRLNENAQRLVNLVAALNLDARQGDLVVVTTPYGVQMSWTLGKHRLPFFVHLKDCGKFKAKKRWSQVMYMNYILNHRCKIINSDKMASGGGMTRQNSTERSLENEQTKQTGVFYEPLKNTSEVIENLPSRTKGKIKRNQTTITGRSKKNSDAGHCNMAALLDSELERLNALLNARRHDSLSKDKTRHSFSVRHLVSTNRCKSLSRRTSSLRHCTNPAEIALSVSNILSLVLNGCCSNECLNFTLTNKPFLVMTSEESSGEDSESATHSDAYTVSGKGSVTNDEALVDTDEDDEGEMTDKSSSCDDHHKPMSWKIAKIHTTDQRHFPRLERQDIWPDNERSNENEDRRMTQGDYKADECVIECPSSGPRSAPPLKEIKVDHTKTLTPSSLPCSEDYHESIKSKNKPDLKSEQAKSDPNNTGFTNQDKCGRAIFQRFWSSGRASSKSSFVPSIVTPAPSSFSEIGRVDKKADIFSITGSDSVDIESYAGLWGQPDAVHFDDRTYILATDADMDFDDSSVCQLLDLCNRDKRVGGACGRTHPIGQRNNPVVWYQKFEYAKDFWMIKSSQNVIGCVMCCPGCFSLYRADAVKDIMETYHQPTRTPFDVFIKDHGEDRWLCTLMMLHGWKLEYTPYSENSTFCPDTFLEFLKQRKRWVLSELSNLMLVFENLRQLARRNSSFSVIYIVYILQMFLLVILSPGTTIIVLTASLDVLFGLPCIYTTPVLFAGLVLYTITCSTQSIRVQSMVSLAITIFLGIIVLSLSAGFMHFIITDTIIDLEDGHLEFKQYYLLLVLMLGVLYAAFTHPNELPTLIHGLTFLLSFPAMYILLPFYAVANIVDQRWGTRDQETEKGVCKLKISGCLRKKEQNLSATRGQRDQENGDEIKLTERMDPSQFQPLSSGSAQQREEGRFWEDLRTTILGRDVNLGIDAETMSYRLKRMRNRFAAAILFLNLTWLAVLTTMYVIVPRHDNVFALVACTIYSFSLVIQLVGLTAHKCDSLFRQFVIKTFGKKHPIWINPRNEH